MFLARDPDNGTVMKKVPRAINSRIILKHEKLNKIDDTFRLQIIFENSDIILYLNEKSKNNY